MSKHWVANWIWNDLPDYTPNIYVEFRKSFEFNQKRLLSLAEIDISANQEYILFINGTKIGRGPSPSDIRWQYYDTYDITDEIKDGENIISILAYNFGTKDIITQQYQGPGGVIAQLNMQTASKSITITSDSTWKCRQSPRWVQDVSRQHKWNGFREIYLAEKEDGWELLHYNDSNWDHAHEIAAAKEENSPWPRLIQREIPFLHHERISPKEIVRRNDNFGSIRNERKFLRAKNESMTIDASTPGSLPEIVFDYEQEVVGYVYLKINAPEGGVVQLHYGETLELELYDTFILKKGVNLLNPFGRRAFRFVKLAVQATPQPITIHDIGIEFVHYPFETQGTFESSDPLLNRIWEIGVYTTKINSQDHLEDTPLRERALWVVDEVVMGKVIYSVFNDTRLLKKCLLQGARIQNEDGSIPGTGPEKNDMMLPDFCTHWLFGVYGYWQFTKDKAFIHELWPNIKRLLDWFKDHETEQGLFTINGKKDYWCFIDWAEYIDRRDQVTALSCFYYKVLTIAADLAELMEEKALVKEWEEKAKHLKNMIRRTMWSQSHQAYVDCVVDEAQSDNITYQTNFVAMWSGVMSDDDADYFITEYFFKDKAPEIKGPFFYHIVLEELFKRKYQSKALDVIRNYWGEMVARGATTWWESFESNSPRCTIPSPYQGHTPTYLLDYIPVSLCHGWGASPTYLMNQYILGVNVFELGSNKVLLKPLPTDLDWAKGSIPTKYGFIKVEWKKKKNGEIDYYLEIPDNLLLKGEFPAAMNVHVNGKEIESKTTIKGGDGEKSYTHSN